MTMELKVMTFNVYMDGHLDEEAAENTVKAILESQAHVICLQESNRGWQQFLEPKVAIIYPHTYFHNDTNSYGGRGVLSKHPIKDTKWFKKVFDWWYGALLTTIDVGGVDISLLSLHLRAPFPSNPLIVQSQRQTEIEEHMKQLDTTKNLIILGNFSCAQGPCHCFLAELGFSSALQKAGKSCMAKTWNLRGMVGFLFDHVYYNSSDFHLVDAVVKQVGGSDHWPLLAHFKL